MLKFTVGIHAEDLVIVTKQRLHTESTNNGVMVAAMCFLMKKAK